MYPEYLFKEKSSAQISTFPWDVLTIHASAVMFAWIAMHPTPVFNVMLISHLQNAPQPLSMPGTSTKWLTPHEQPYGQDFYD